MRYDYFGLSPKSEVARLLVKLRGFWWVLPFSFDACTKFVVYFALVK